MTRQRSEREYGLHHLPVSQTNRTGIESFLLQVSQGGLMPDFDQQEKKPGEPQPSAEKTPTQKPSAPGAPGSDEQRPISGPEAAAGATAAGEPTIDMGIAGRPVERGKTPGRSGARGTAAMDPGTRKEVARKGGLAVSRNRQHMAEIGRKGGQSVSQNREHMAKIGRKGGAASRGHR